MEQLINQIRLRGELVSLPQFSFENRAGKFYQFTLMVPRLSGTADRIPVIIQEQVLNELDIDGGEMLTISGIVRSNTVRMENGRRLYIFVLATGINSEDGDPINEVVLDGTICREPIYRRTPLGREICDVMLAVDRRFHRADFLPCILWGRTARQISSCRTRDIIRISGRFQSRDYTKVTDGGPQERTAYEISAMTAEILSMAEEGSKQE